MDKEAPAPYTPAELWLTQHQVVAVRTSYKMTSEDTCDNYVELESFHGEKVKWLQSTFNKVATLRVGGTNLAELRLGIRDRVEKRLKWEKANAAELATFKRLKAKFEGSAP